MVQALHELVASRIPAAGDHTRNMMLVVMKSAGLDLVLQSHLLEDKLLCLVLSLLRQRLHQCLFRIY